MNSVHVIVDLQFGSCGKGLFAGYLAETLKPDGVAIAWGPNSGHTYISAEGHKFINVALPNGIVSPNIKRIFIGPGSVINPEILLMEINQYMQWIKNAEILIHENAAIVTPAHRNEEAGTAFKIGSTMKGVGAAVIDKIRRDPDNNTTAKSMLAGTPLERFVVSVQRYNEAMDATDTLLVEGSQGFSLGINQGFYPYVTSRDCTVNQIMSDCSIPYRNSRQGSRVSVYGVCRTFPIRVANRYDDNGDMIGWSGPGYFDQREMKWSELGIEPELTTVTKLPRRLFTFSMDQIEQAVRMNGCDTIFMNFANYMLAADAYKLAEEINDRTGVPVDYIGWGPTKTDIEVGFTPMFPAMKSEFEIEEGSGHD